MIMLSNIFQSKLKYYYRACCHQSSQRLKPLAHFLSKGAATYFGLSWAERRKSLFESQLELDLRPTKLPELVSGIQRLLRYPNVHNPVD